MLGLGSIHNVIAAAPDFAANHKEGVVLYATSWCGNCAQTRKFLKSANIPYFEYDVEKSAEGQRQFKELRGIGVPLILVNKTLIRGYNPSAIFTALKANKLLPSN